MKKNISPVILLTGLLLLFLSESCKPSRVLVFSKTLGFRHTSIAAGKTALLKLGAANKFAVDTTEDASVFTKAQLKKYASVVFLNTTGDVLDSLQQFAFTRYIKRGGGFVGVHSATDTEYGWPWYGKMVGAYFNGHPKPQEATFIIKDKIFLATSFFTDTIWKRTDELYNFKNMNPDVHVLVCIDESSYEGGTNGSYHPFSWYHAYDGGRAFYTAMGHTDETYSDSNFIKHLLGGIKYAMKKK